MFISPNLFPRKYNSIFMG